MQESHGSAQQVVASDAATRPQTSAVLQQSVPFNQFTVFAIGGSPELSRWAAKWANNATSYLQSSRLLLVWQKRIVMPVTKQTIIISPWERVLAILAAVLCLTITILLWLSVSAYQAMWPLPALYFIEIATLSIISAFMFVRGDPRGQFITWSAAGIIGVFSILAAFSVGFFYLPVALIFAVISVTSSVRNQKPITAHLGIFLIAGIAQLALMLAAI